MKLNKIIKEQRFDNRIIEWGLRDNLISAKEYAEYLKSLPDLSDQTENMQILDRTGLKKKNTKAK